MHHGFQVTQPSGCGVALTLPWPSPHHCPPKPNLSPSIRPSLIVLSLEPVFFVSGPSLVPTPSYKLEARDLIPHVTLTWPLQVSVCDSMRLGNDTLGVILEGLAGTELRLLLFEIFLLVYLVSVVGHLGIVSLTVMDSRPHPHHVLLLSQPVAAGHCLYLQLGASVLACLLAAVWPVPQ